MSSLLNNAENTVTPMLSEQAPTESVSRRFESPSHSASDADQSGVVIIGADFQAVGVMRALEDAKIPFVLIAHERGIATASRFAKRVFRRYDLLTADDGADFLCELAKRESLDGWTVACVDDNSVEFLAKNHALLSQHFLLPVPNWETTRKFFEKDRAYALAEECGLTVPRQYPSGELSDLLLADIEYPVVLKPTFKKNFYEKTHSKAILVSDREELVREFTTMRSLIPASQIVVQEFIPGGTKNLFSYASLFDGEKMVAGIAAVRLRQHPMDFGHATTYAEARDMPELCELASRFLRALHFRGVAEVEFMYDERSGEFKFIEMNGRFWGWHSLTFTAGLNLPRDLDRMLRGLDIEPCNPNYGAKWMRLLTDAPTVLGEFLRGRISPFTYLRHLTTNRSFAVLSWRDPLPFMKEICIAPYLWWKKGF